VNLKEVVKNISYSFSANLISLLISVFMVLFVPKLLSVNDYGLWQLFLFYYSYLGFLHFGWEDGIYLRYAGKTFNELDRKTFAGQFYCIILLQIVLVVVISILSQVFVVNSDRRLALLCAIWLAPFVNFNNLCNFIMQMTNRIKGYARLLITERIIFFLGVLSFLVILGWNQFRYMYVAQVFAVVSMAVVGVYLCRSLLSPHFDSFAAIQQEVYKNLNVGSKLMLANTASILIIGIVRYGISIGWDVATFGKISLTLGISNFFMVFINSVSIVFFPIVKQMDEDKRSETYTVIRSVLTFLLFAGLIGYYPIRYILSLWLPKYADSLVYMRILFPVYVFASKVSLLINTYLKSMREEFLMLKINIVSVIFSLIITVFTVGMWHNLDVAVFSIVIIYAFRCGLSEYYITKLLKLNFRKNMIEDLLMCTIFIVSGWAFDNFLCMVVYGVAYAVFVLIHRCNLQQILRALKE
jgi:O-antigen/teichoic acid export membrane protein